MTQVYSFSIARLNNQEFVALLLNLKKQLRDNDTELLGIDDALIDVFDTKMQRITDQVYAAASSPLIQQMRAADEKRTMLYRKVRMKLQLVDCAEEGSPLIPIIDVVHNGLLSKYGARVTQMPMQEKTAVIQGFVFDIRHQLTEDDIDALSLTEDTGKLDQANNDFINAYSQRLAEKAEQEAQSTVVLRQELTGIFHQICFALQYYANHPSAEKKEQVEACQAFIRLFNVAIADAKARYTQRRKKAGEDPDADLDDDDITPGGNNGSNTGSGNGSGGASTGDNGANTNPGGSNGSNTGSGNGTGGTPTGDNGTGNSTGGGNNSNTGSSNGTGGTSIGDNGADNNPGGNNGSDPNQGIIHDGMMEF